MGLALVGVSHHDVPLSALDEINRSATSLANDLVGEPHAGVSGAVLLSTCNRVEIYVEADDPRRAADGVRNIFLKRTGNAVDIPMPTLGLDVARHLFSVAAGLESMIVGEDEVSGQVKRAITRARKERTASASLERLFQTASATSKRVSATSGLGAAGRSIVSVALDLVEQDFGSVGEGPALLIGTGAFARVAHASLRKRGVEEVMVYSSSGRAKRFVETHGGTVVEQAGLVDSLRRAALVVACSGAPHPVLDAHTLAIVTEGRQRALPVLDLALTQDVDDEARSLMTVTVIDLDVISRHAPEEHGEAVTRAHRMVNEAVEHLGVQEAERNADAMVVAMRSHVVAIMEREQRRAASRLGGEAAAHVAEALHRFTGELLHEPTVRARQFTREGSADEFEQAVRTVFGIETGPRS